MLRRFMVVRARSMQGSARLMKDPTRVISSDAPSERLPVASRRRGYDRRPIIRRG